MFARRRVRHACQVLLRLHRELAAHRPERRARVRAAAQDDLQVHEDRGRGHPGHRRHVRLLPRLQVPGLHGRQHPLQGNSSSWMFVWNNDIGLVSHSRCQ